MSNARKVTVPVVTAADGTASVDSPRLTGRVVNIIYTKDGTNPYSNTVDFTITAKESGLSLWTQADRTASQTVSPLQKGQIDGVDSTLIHCPIYLADEPVNIALAQGGNAKNGSFVIVVA